MPLVRPSRSAARRRLGALVALALSPAFLACRSEAPPERPRVAARAPVRAAPRAEPPGAPGEDPAPRRLGTPAGSAPTPEDVRTFAEVNRVRRERGLAPFRWSDRLFRAAYDHSLEQHAHGYMGHGSPDPARDDLGDRLRTAGYAGSTWAEVVAWGYEGPMSVVDGWMNSRGHRKILTDPSLREAAFARVGDYFTGDFGTPR